MYRRKKSITVDQLLTHMSGLPPEYAADGVTDRQSDVEAILREPLVHDPGAGSTYSNENYNLLAAIIEVASGRSYDDFLRQELFSMAGLEVTELWGASFRDVAWWREELAKARSVADVLRAFGGKEGGD